jgi:hypothetical protein
MSLHGKQEKLIFFSTFPISQGIGVNQQFFTTFFLGLRDDTLKHVFEYALLGVLLTGLAQRSTETCRSTVTGEGIHPISTSTSILRWGACTVINI